MKTFINFNLMIKSALILLLISSVTLFAQPFEKTLDKYLELYKTSNNVPSVCAGAVVNGRIAWTSALGFADLENSVKTSDKTVYRLASISKPITAVAIMQLVEKKKINLDDDVRKYVHYFPKKKWNITIRQLLTHTSGIRSYKPGEFDSKNYYPKIKDAIEVLANDSLDSKPGTKYNYNTLAYNLLAAVIENVSGMTFSEYLEANIFIPSEMALTKLEFQSDIVPNRAHGYIRNDKGIVQNAPLADLSSKYAGGGIISTIEDLLKFGEALLSNKLISKTTLDSMLRPTVLPSGQVINYGYGLGFGTDSLGSYFGHSAGGTGFCANLVIYPKSKAVFAYLMNIRDNKELGNPSLDIAAILLGKGGIDKTFDIVSHKYLQK